MPALADNDTAVITPDELVKMVENYIIENIFNKQQTKIYARKLIIKIPTQSDKKIFLNENHLQGNDKSNIYFGL